MSPRTKTVTLKGLLEAGSNLLLAMMYVPFVYAFFLNFIKYHRAGSLLFLFVESFFLYFAIVRDSPRTASRSITVWFFAFTGTFLPLFLRPTRQEEALAGYVLQLAGIILIGLSILSLGKSFGVVAANRGIVTRGMYKYVRHPLYISYAINMLGVILNNFTMFNAAIFVLGLVIQLIRIRHEEALLLRDAAYREYRQTTRWRLVPHLY